MQVILTLKHVIVVDDDVDIFDPKDVFWAMVTRVQADKDIFIVPDAFSYPLDRTSRNGVTAKIGIDATKPLDRKDEFERVSWLDIDLQRYLGNKKIILMSTNAMRRCMSLFLIF